MTRKKTSLRDIAEKAQVSTALVSYVLNGKEKQGRVGPAMALKIRRIADELNYQPNYLAKSLRLGKTLTIGLIIADISNPFFANIARIVEDEAKKYGYTVIIGSSDENKEKSWNLIQVLLNRQVDGFIIVSSEDTEAQILFLKERNIAFVLLDRHFPEIPTDFVSLNHYKAAFDAGAHLIDAGYRNPGMIAYQSRLFHMQERIRGFREALAEKEVRLPPNGLKEVGFTTIGEEIRAGIDAMLAGNPPVDALLFATYRLAISGLRYINELGLKVPDDLAIISFGQAEAFDLYYCPLTYLEQPMNELGKTAVEVLMARLNDPDGGPTRILMEAKLIARDSSRIKMLTG